MSAGTPMGGAPPHTVPNVTSRGRPGLPWGEVGRLYRPFPHHLEVVSGDIPAFLVSGTGQNAATRSDLHHSLPTCPTIIADRWDSDDVGILGWVAKNRHRSHVLLTSSFFATADTGAFVEHQARRLCGGPITATPTSSPWFRKLSRRGTNLLVCRSTLINVCMERRRYYGPRGKGGPGI